MKRIMLFFITLLFVVSLFGQEKEKKYFKEPFPFDEFVISVNRTNVFSSGTENRFGCGAGAYHSTVLSERWNYMYGLEYNYTSLFAESVYSTPRFYEENITFHIHTVSEMPMAFRFSMGKNIKYFFEAGMSIGLSFADKKGEAYSINPHPTPENPENYFPTDTGDVRAGNSITLKPGFSTVSEKTFRAYISPLSACSKSGEESPNFSDDDNSVNNQQDLLSNIKNEPVSEVSVSTFPNPNNGRFYIQVQNAETINHIEVINMYGMIIDKFDNNT